MAHVVQLAIGVVGNYAWNGAALAVSEPATPPGLIDLSTSHCGTHSHRLLRAHKQVATPALPTHGRRKEMKMARKDTSVWATGVVAGWSWPPAPMENDEQLASPNEVGRWTSGGGRVLQPTSDGSLFLRAGPS